MAKIAALATSLGLALGAETEAEFGQKKSPSMEPWGEGSNGISSAGGSLCCYAIENRCQCLVFVNISTVSSRALYDRLTAYAACWHTRLGPVVALCLSEARLQSANK